MGTKNDPGEYDCYAHAEPDEPIFVLRARDVLAADIVRTWADRRSLHNADPAKIVEARACARAMDVWRAARERQKRITAIARRLAAADGLNWERTVDDGESLLPHASRQFWMQLAEVALDEIEPSH